MCLLPLLPFRQHTDAAFRRWHQQRLLHSEHHGSLCPERTERESERCPLITAGRPSNSLRRDLLAPSGSHRLTGPLGTKGEEEERKSTSLLKQAALPGALLHLHTPAVLGKEGLCRRMSHPMHSSPTGRIYTRFYSPQHNPSFQATLIRWKHPHCFNPLSLPLLLLVTLLLFAHLLL